MAGSSSAATGHWPGAATGQLALAGGHYYCPVAAETLLQAAGPGTAQGSTDQLVYAGPTQHASYQTVDLADGAHHLVAAGQSSEVHV